MIHLKWLVVATYLMASLSNLAQADSNGIIEFDGYKVHYSVVNSDAISAEAAGIYGIKRSVRLGLLTIVVVPSTQTYNGIEVLIGGDVSNMLQQQAALNFKPIDEGDTIYYIAPFKFDHRELLNFKVHIKAESDKYSNTVEFSHSLFKKGYD